MWQGVRALASCARTSDSSCSSDMCPELRQVAIAIGSGSEYGLRWAISRRAAALLLSVGRAAAKDSHAQTSRSRMEKLDPVVVHGACIKISHRVPGTGTRYPVPGTSPFSYTLRQVPFQLCLGARPRWASSWCENTLHGRLASSMYVHACRPTLVHRTEPASGRTRTSLAHPPTSPWLVPARRGALEICKP